MKKPKTNITVQDKEPKEDPKGGRHRHHHHRRPRERVPKADRPDRPLLPGQVAP